MKILAPEVFRQRLLMEGYYTIEVTKQSIIDYFTTVTTSLALRMYGEPIIFSPEGTGKEGNQGFDAFVPLIDSGISLYVWSQAKFLSLIIYTCKRFDEKIALEETKQFFQVLDMQSKSF